MAMLHTRREIELHVVAQVIKTKLVVRAVGDIGVVSGLPLEIIHVVLDATDGQTEEAMNLAHPLGVARGQVIVYGDDVYAAPGQRIQIRRQRCYERLSFARAHLGRSEERRVGKEGRSRWSPYH